MNKLMLLLAAGVATLAITAPVYAGPHGGGGKAGGQAAEPEQKAPRAQRQQARAERQAPVQRVERQQARAERQAPRGERQQVRQQARVERQAPRVERQQVRQQARVERQAPRIERQQQVREQRVQQAENRQVERQQMRIDRVNVRNNGQVANGYGVGGCPPGLANKGCAPPGLVRNGKVIAGGIAGTALIGGDRFRADRIANADAFRTSRLAALAYDPRMAISAPAQVVRYIGQPVNSLANVVPLAALPSSVSYLYPETPDYYYRYGDGYLYQVDRGSNLISSLLPLLAGGIMPGSYLPSSYMNSYVPSYYGLNSFYPSSYSGYGYGPSYNNLCNRYVDGVVYQVDCATGLVADVYPTYAGGYGVGQMIPSAYSYYNVPSQYRNMYYDNGDNGYWYAPGAIYQYDQRSSLITSVAALLSPGMTIGQPLPLGYDAYNVPYAYRNTYADTSNAWYRYNNGYIYQVDPTTQVVTAIVASLLT